ncbi:MAG: efflux RND transporter periplasmic adaptor subunit [Vampirovibrionia bacterium]
MGELKMFEKLMDKLVNFFRDFKYLKLPTSTLFAFLGVLLALFYISTKEFKIKAKAPVTAAANKPFTSSISGTGIIESVGKNIDIAPYYAGRVAEVFVKEGDSVNINSPLFKLNDLETRAGLASIKAELDAQNAVLKNIKQQYSRLENLENKSAVSEQDISSKALELEKANADFRKLEARIREQEILLEHSIIKSTVAGKVLQVNIRAGEYIIPSSNPAPIVLAEDKQYQVRVDIDEINASHIRPNQKAYAFLKGDTSKKFPLEFVRIEPYMVPKKDLTGNTAERHDIRVLQIIYYCKKPEFPIYIGQQLEIYLEKS